MLLARLAEYPISNSYADVIGYCSRPVLSKLLSANFSGYLHEISIFFSKFTGRFYGGLYTVLMAFTTACVKGED